MVPFLKLTFILCHGIFHNLQRLTHLSHFTFHVLKITYDFTRRKKKLSYHQCRTRQLR